MLMRCVLSVLVFCLLCKLSFAQQKQYFQQEVNSIIEVSLFEKEQMLRGNISLEYINNSPDTLSFIWLLLYPNAYSCDQSAFARQLLENDDASFYFSDDSQKGFIDSLSFKCGTALLNLEFDSLNPDLAKLYLKTPLFPGSSVTVQSPFRVKFPAVFSRMGYDDGVFHVTQWYPKPAVYDRDGWHPYPYLDQGEFYSEFGSYNVQITVPADFTVAATGDLIDCPKEQFRIDSIASLTQKLIKGQSAPACSALSGTKTLTFYQDSVIDFAWFASRDFLLVRDTVILPSGRKVETSVWFPSKELQNWKGAIIYVNRAVESGSEWYGEYPFTTAKAVCGSLLAGGGMEYPTITIIAAGMQGRVLEQVISHEVGHNYFQGIIASDERLNPWMDEGVNSFSDLRYAEKYYGTMLLDLMSYAGRPSGALKWDINYLAYLYLQRQRDDQAASLRSEDYSMMNYGVIVYMKAARLFIHLQEYLGHERFDQCMQLYYERWSFKHPSPDDMQMVFEEQSGESLGWFFDTLLSTNLPLDYAITKVIYDKKADSSWVVIKNRGACAAPIGLYTSVHGSTNGTFWYKGFERVDTIGLIGRYSSFVLSSDMTETNVYNNNYRYFAGSSLVRSIFPKTEPFHLKLLMSFRHPERRGVFWFPVVGWNHRSGIMPGVLLYSNPAIVPRFEYRIMPLFARNAEKMGGEAEIKLSIFPNHGPVHCIRPFGHFVSYFLADFEDEAMRWMKADAGIEFDLRKSSPRSKVSSRITLSAIGLQQENVFYEQSSPGVWSPFLGHKDLLFVYGNFSRINSKILNPSSISSTVLVNAEMMRLQCDWKKRIHYNDYKKFLDVRLFAGGFIYAKDDFKNEADWRFRLSSPTPSQDILYDHVQLGRDAAAQNLLWQQTTISEGGFMSWSPIGQTWKWLAAANFRTTLPGRIPFRFYLSIGTYAEAWQNKQLLKFPWETGLAFHIGDYFHVDFPLLVSKDLLDAAQLNLDNYGQRIRFVINFDRMNPFNLIQNAGQWF